MGAVQENVAGFNCVKPKGEVEVPEAIRKGVEKAKRTLVTVSLDGFISCRFLLDLLLNKVN